MNLSDLINYRHQVRDLIKRHWYNPVTDSLSRVQSGVYIDKELVVPPDLAHRISQVNSMIQHISKQVNHTNEMLQELDDAIQQEINKWHEHYQSQSQHLYQSQSRFTDIHHILESRLDITQQQRDFLQARLMTHSSWCDIGMIIRPANEDFVVSMSGMSLLYLYDSVPQLLEPAITRFPQHHREKYRDYHGTSIGDLDQIPKGQARLIFVQNFFNFMPVDVMYQYLEVLCGILRPGGTIIFTYNDCDHAVNVGFCERSWQCYQPGSEVLARTRALALELRHRQWYDNGFAWMEMQLPGKYRPLKAAPIVTKIHTRSK